MSVRVQPQEIPQVRFEDSDDELCNILMLIMGLPKRDAGPNVTARLSMTDGTVYAYGGCTVFFFFVWDSHSFHSTYSYPLIKGLDRRRALLAFFLFPVVCQSSKVVYYL